MSVYGLKHRLKLLTDDTVEIEQSFYRRKCGSKGEIWLLETLSVFQRLVLQTRKNQGLFGKGLKAHKKNIGWRQVKVWL